MSAIAAPSECPTTVTLLVPFLASTDRTAASTAGAERACESLNPLCTCTLELMPGKRCGSSEARKKSESSTSEMLREALSKRARSKERSGIHCVGVGSLMANHDSVKVLVIADID
jgi:hypothetical protein